MLNNIGLPGLLLIAVVVLPTPPFWLAMAMMRGARDPVMSLTFDLRYSQDDGAVFRLAGHLLAVEGPCFKRFGDLCVGPGAFRQKRGSAGGEMAFAVDKEVLQGCQGAGGQDAGAQGFYRFHPGGQDSN